MRYGAAYVGEYPPPPRGDGLPYAPNPLRRNAGAVRSQAIRKPVVRWTGAHFREFVIARYRRAGGEQRREFVEYAEVVGDVGVRDPIDGDVALRSGQQRRQPDADGVPRADLHDGAQFRIDAILVRRCQMAQPDRVTVSGRSLAGPSAPELSGQCGQARRAVKNPGKVRSEPSPADFQPGRGDPAPPPYAPNAPDGVSGVRRGKATAVSGAARAR